MQWPIGDDRARTATRRGISVYIALTGMVLALVIRLADATQCVASCALRSYRIALLLALLQRVAAVLPREAARASG